MVPPIKSTGFRDFGPEKKFGYFNLTRDCTSDYHSGISVLSIYILSPTDRFIVFQQIGPLSKQSSETMGIRVVKALSKFLAASSTYLKAQP